LRVEAVVLRHADWGEADRLLWLFSREQGKLRAVAKGARKLLSRKAGHLQPFTRVALMLSHGRDLWIVTQAETVDTYLPIRQDLLRTGYAAYTAELLDRFTYEEGENSLLYRLLVETLERISNEEDAFWAVRYFEIHLLDLLGFKPELFECVVCREPIQPEDQFFSLLQGGVMCPRCGSHEAVLKPVSLEALRFLRHFQRSTYLVAHKARVPEVVRQEMEALLQVYLTFLLERGLNSPTFLRAVRN
jgi:DNA repair protein RecO (recombination protein O)